MEEGNQKRILEIKASIEEDNFQQALELLSKIDEDDLMKITELIEFKVIALAELGMIKEAIMLSEHLDAQSNIRLKIKNFFKITQNKPATNEEFNALKSFEEFCSQNGLYRKKTSIVYFDNCLRGVIANSKIKKCEVIMRIPEKVIIHAEIGKKGKIASQIGDQLISFMEEIDYSGYEDYIFIFIYMLEERENNNSFWKPFWNCLSNNVSYFPFFYTETEKILCKGNNILNNYEFECTKRKQVYDFICEKIPDFRFNSFTQFMENFSILLARWFGYINKEDATSST